jgi:hypothetical protein
MVERFIRTLKEQCIHRQRFDSIQHATRAIGHWISFYNHRRPVTVRPDRYLFQRQGSRSSTFVIL